jgi:hypothetical protein
MIAYREGQAADLVGHRRMPILSLHEVNSKMQRPRDFDDKAIDVLQAQFKVVFRFWRKPHLDRRLDRAGRHDGDDKR